MSPAGPVPGARPSEARRARARVHRRLAAHRAAAAASAALALAALAGCGQAGRFEADDPRSAVAQLLNASISQANGQRACSLLTEAAQTRLARGPAGSCRQALNASVSTMPGPSSATDDAGRATTDLDFEVLSRTAERARVSARRGENRALTFDLVRLGAAELEAATAGSRDTVGGTVDSEWRVDAGERQLVEVDTDPAPATRTPPVPAPAG